MRLDFVGYYLRTSVLALRDFLAGWDHLLDVGSGSRKPCARNFPVGSCLAIRVHRSCYVGWIRWMMRKSTSDSS